jgi:hypothetical protein
LDIWTNEQCNKILPVEGYSGLDNKREEVQQEYEKRDMNKQLLK